ncbi:sensor histidine kinase [Novosphingobium sp. FGD1]|uniref:histidine kinase n=1 Tax=Novosphingobium silvae TaxID=2692619 RepID=A0A7X4GHW1_9SPHN|nr:ATP-binding protein [Novosphingobium silvae]MYL98539.1 sensor histidine kinase [Novosphingobium silvae]
MRSRLLLWLAGALALALLVAFLVGLAVRGTVTARFAEQAAADARLRQALLENEVARFRLLPLGLRDDRDLVALMERRPGAQAVMNAKLERLSREFGSPILYVVRGDGLTLAASNWRDPRSFIGKDYSFRPYFRAAMRTGAGEQFALGTVSHRPGLFFARRAAGGSVVVMKMEFDRVETQWREGRGETFVTDRDGVVLVTSRRDWRYAATRPLSAERRAAKRRTIGVPALGPAPFELRGGGRIRMPGIAGDHLLASTSPDASGWRVNLVVAMGEVNATVRAAQLGAALATLALAGLALFLRERGRQRAERTAQLEAAVAGRTADLRREIEERAAAEEHAAQLREGLRQANRLATLGQVTASVAHETAQPVAAIRNYAATSRQLLDMGASDEVRANLSAIDRLAERIGTVTAELRGFARKGARAGGPIALDEVIDGACLLLKERLSHVVFERPAIPSRLTVFGGRVRLEQVLVNVLQNALEALDGRPDPRLAITLEVDGDMVRLIVADNGPGISPELAGRLFTPFATSRPSGLGLGLVIAKDIAEDFGGSLNLVPSDEGACFAITLRRAS